MKGNVHGMGKARPVNVSNSHPAIKSSKNHPEATYAGSNVHRTSAKTFGSRMTKGK